MMNKEECKHNLKELFKILNTLKTPAFSENAEISGLVESIIELDPYYAGMASSVAEGGKINVKKLYNLEELKAQIEKTLPITKADLDIYNHCKEYCAVFCKIDDQLKIICKN